MPEIDALLHFLTYTYISHLLEKGTNPRRVQEPAGHRVFATTWRYSHVLPSEEVAEDLLEFWQMIVAVSECREVRAKKSSWETA